MGDYRDTEKLLRMFRSVECACCQRHFGFQERLRRELQYCSSACVGKVMENEPNDGEEVCENGGNVSVVTAGAGTKNKVSKPMATTEVNHVVKPEMEQRRRAPDANDVVDHRQTNLAAATTKMVNASIEENHVKPEKPMVVRSQVQAAGIQENKLVRGQQQSNRSEPARARSPVVDREIRIAPKEPEKVKPVRNPFIEKFPEPDFKAKMDPKPLLKVPGTVPVVEFGINKNLSKLSDELTWDELEIGDQMSVEKTHAVSTTDFYVQTASGAGDATIMMQEIYDALMKKENKVPLRNLRIGTLCLAPFEDIFYRGEIVEITGQPPVYTIHFSDYGNAAECVAKELLELPEQFKKAPRYAINCKWDMALTKELDPEKEAAIFESAEAGFIIPRVKIADGQYLVSIGKYTPKIKLMLK